MLLLNLQQIFKSIKDIMVEINMHEQVDEIISKVLQGNTVQNSSSQMLLLQVEDILSYAQIQNNRFSKNP